MAHPRDSRVFHRSAGKVDLGDLGGGGGGGLNGGGGGVSGGGRVISWSGGGGGDLRTPWQEEQRRRRASPLPWLPSTSSSEEVEEVDTVRCPFRVREGEESAVWRE